MADASDGSVSTAIPFLRLKALSILLLPLSPAIVWGFTTPQIPDGELGIGGGIALFFLFLLVPLTWAVIFVLFCTVLNTYTWLVSSRPVHRSEGFLTGLAWMPLLLLVAIAGTSGLQHPRWLGGLYVVSLATALGYYLYVLYHVVKPSSGLKYTSFLFRAGFAIVYVLVGVEAAKSALELLFVRFSFLQWFNVLVLLVFAILTGLGALVVSSYYSANRPADG